MRDSPTIRVEEYGLSGVDLIAALHQESFPADTGERWRRIDILQALRMPGTFGLVASREELACGHALIRLVADECELLALGVLAPARRSGVARALLERLSERCRQANIRRIFLEVREDNAAARSFYEANGFHRIGTRRDYYKAAGGGLVNAVTMACDLLSSP